MADFKLADGIVFLKDEGMIIDVQSKRVRKYNQSAIRILAILSDVGPNSIPGIIELLNENFDGIQDMFPEEYVSEFLDSLEASGVAVKCDSGNTAIDG